MAASMNNGAGATPPAQHLIITATIEGDPAGICRRTLYATIEGRVIARMELSSIGQVKVAHLLRECANQLAALEGDVLVVA
ncbi:MAG: hypothetical protein IVW54_22320 [Candidatus Binataceae bacterium]|nr:hypothetical protein [Candidatus Binataceae bacterium]